MFFHQRTDSTERGILGQAVRRVRVMDAASEHYLAPLRCGLKKRTLRREGKSSGSEGLLKITSTCKGGAINSAESFPRRRSSNPS